jgi:hypothetical protein
LICNTYINKIHLLFGSTFHKNSTVKCAWLGALFGWVTYWKVPRKCDWGYISLEWLMMPKDSKQFFKKQYEMLHMILEHTSSNTMWFGGELDKSWWTCDAYDWWGLGVIAGAQDMYRQWAVPDSFQSKEGIWMI